MDYLNQYLQTGQKDEAAISFYASLDLIYKTSPKIAKAILQELKDQRKYLKLIASENYSSLTVQQAMGNLLTDKYSEGVPYKRFYAGCDNVDTIEAEAVQLAKEIFQVDHAYVQPHSGADANLVAFWAILVQRVQDKEIERLHKKDLNSLTDEEYEKVRQILLSQKMMGMSLDAGGHLTHGYRHNISSKFFKSCGYGVDPKTGLIDYKALSDQVKKEKPLVLVAGYSAYSRLIDFSIMKEIADSVDATLMVDMAHFAGLVAGGVFKDQYNPCKYADIITTTTHKTLRGPRGGMVLCTKEYQEIVDKGCPIVLGGPLPHVMAAKALAFQEIKNPSFKEYAHQIVKNAQALASKLMELGVKVLTGGTDNHLIQVDVQTSFGINGRQAENLLRKALITVNRNAIPFDQNGPWYTSGIRLGTPALTTLGMKEVQMSEIATVIHNVLSNASKKVLDNGKISKAEAEIDSQILSDNTQKIHYLLKNFCLYPQLILD